MDERAPRRVVGGALFLVLLARLIHLSSAVRGPLTWQLGPDELYYEGFGHDVASGSGGLTELYAFMDPLYGYIVGAMLAVTGHLFPLYLVQIAVDTATAYGLYRIACLLGRPRVGVIAILIYGLTGTAIAYTAAVLKSTWVAAFVTWWMFMWLRSVAQPTRLRWLGFGAFCGLGFALRSNMAILAVLAPVLAVIGPRQARASAVRMSPWFGAGLCLPLLLLAARNHAISGTWSPLPNNGGIVLHQLYNPENPDARAATPRFAGPYSAPPAIWEGYRREAIRRLGRPLPPHEVGRYWGGEALAYILDHPVQTLRNAARKLVTFTAYPEVPNTRNYADEQRVSPLLRALPLPFGWLFALGVPGLVAWYMASRRAIVLIAPIAAGLFTVAIFFAEDRFRFYAITPFVLGASFWLARLADLVRRRERRAVVGALAVSLLLGAWSLAAARVLLDAPVHDWQRFAWGYIKSGRADEARDVIANAAHRAPDADGLHELQGYLALIGDRFAEAAAHYARAVERRPDRVESWHNLSLALEHSGRIDEALLAAFEAERRLPSAATALRVGDVLAARRDSAGAHAAWTLAMSRDRSLRITVGPDGHRIGAAARSPARN